MFDRKYTFVHWKKKMCGTENEQAMGDSEESMSRQLAVEESRMAVLQLSICSVPHQCYMLGKEILFRPAHTSAIHTRPLL